MAGLSFDDILTERGLYYRAGGQGVKDLIKKLKQPSVTEAYFPLTPTDSTRIEKATVQMSRVLQAFQAKFTPLGTMVFKPRKIDLQHMKIDSELTPIDLQTSWLGFLAEKGLEPEDFPITRYYQEHLIEQAAEDFENDEVFAGQYVAPTDGESNDPGQNFNGIRKQLNDGVNNAAIQVIDLGLVPSDPVACVEYIEAMYGSISGDYRKLRKHLDNFFCNEDIAERFRDGMDMKYNTNYAQVKETAKIKNTNIGVVGLPSHNGSDKIWTTPVWNRARYTKNGSQALVFDIQVVDRNVKFLNDHQRGLGFWVDEYVVTNDQDMA